MRRNPHRRSPREERVDHQDRHYSEPPHFARTTGWRHGFASADNLVPGLRALASAHKQTDLSRAAVADPSINEGRLTTHTRSWTHSRADAQGYVLARENRDLHDDRRSIVQEVPDRRTPVGGRSPTHAAPGSSRTQHPGAHRAVKPGSSRAVETVPLATVSRSRIRAGKEEDTASQSATAVGRPRQISR